MKIENWKRVIHTKEETTWQNKSNPDILVQVSDNFGRGFEIKLYNAKDDSWRNIGREAIKNRAVNKAIDFMRVYK